MKGSRKDHVSLQDQLVLVQKGDVRREYCLLPCHQSYLISSYAFRWYHGMLSRVQAETVLRPHSEGSYLVRQVFPASSSSNHSSEARTSSEASGKASGRQDATSRESGNFSRSSQDLGRMDYSLAIKYVLLFFLLFYFTWENANVHAGFFSIAIIEYGPITLL